MIELESIKGFGSKKNEIFGRELVEFILDMTDQNNDKDFTKFLKLERTKIAKFNHIDEYNVYDDKVLKKLVFMKPKSIEVLGKVYGFKKKNISLFGEYLVKRIDEFFKSKC